VRITLTVSCQMEPAHLTAKGTDVPCPNRRSSCEAERRGIPVGVCF
jgi:hypothetical protein